MHISLGGFSGMRWWQIYDLTMSFQHCNHQRWVLARDSVTRFCRYAVVTIKSYVLLQPVFSRWLSHLSNSGAWYIWIWWTYMTIFSNWGTVEQKLWFIMKCTNQKHRKSQVEWKESKGVDHIITSLGCRCFGALHV